MAAQFIVNLLVAIIWLFVTDSYTLNNFVLGFLFGLILVYLLHRVMPGRFLFSKNLSHHRINLHF